MPATLQQSKLQTRESSTVFESVGSRTKRATIATDSPVEVFAGGRIVREVLVLSGLTIPESVPLLVDHERSTRSTVGTVNGFVARDGKLEGDLSFASGTTAADETWQLASQGHLRSVSVGYRVRETEHIPGGREKTIGGKSYRGPLRVVTKWSIHEVSVVPVPADPDCVMRSRSLPVQRTEGKRIMPANQTLERDIRQMRLCEYAHAFTDSHRGHTTGSDAEMLRSWLAVGGLDDITGKLGGWLNSGFHASADSTVGWVRELPLPNYLQQRIATITKPVVPIKLGRGGVGAPVVMASQYETWRLFRTAISFEISEEDIIDSNDSLDIMALALREIGAAFRRTVLDAIWGLILSNPTLADGTALFHTDRGNLGTAAFTATSLGAAWAQIAGQTRQITEDSTVNAHENIVPSILITDPSDTVSAVTHVTSVSPGAALVKVRSESRLGTSGFLDPRDDTVRSGNASNWLLAASSNQAPGIVLGTLNGRREPRFRSYELTGAKWGMGFSAELSLGVTAVSGAPLFFSTGVA